MAHSGNKPVRPLRSPWSPKSPGDRRGHQKANCRATFHWRLVTCTPAWEDDLAGPADIVRLGAAGLFDVVLRVDEHWAAIERTLRKYVDLQAALADACLIRCAEIHDEPRILTFDADFRVYRWSGRKRFEMPH